MGWNTSPCPSNTLARRYASTKPSTSVHLHANQTRRTHFGISDYADFSFCAISRSVFGTQFHPERSGDAGLRILQNFTTWDTTSCC